jgi:hypothetical protein
MVPTYYEKQRYERQTPPHLQFSISDGAWFRRVPRFVESRGHPLSGKACWVNSPDAKIENVSWKQHAGVGAASAKTVTLVTRAL